MNIVIIPGDGIGPETMQVSVESLDTVNAQFGLGLRYSSGLQRLQIPRTCVLSVQKL